MNWLRQKAKKGVRPLIESSLKGKPAGLQRVQRQFGKRIRTLRQNRGLTSEQLAKGCRVTTVKISKIEDGQVNIALSTMIHLSKRLGARLDRLFRGIR